MENRKYFINTQKFNIENSMEQAAHRETLEEAGIKIKIEGILRVEHTFHATYARMRFELFSFELK